MESKHWRKLCHLRKDDFVHYDIRFCFAKSFQNLSLDLIGYRTHGKGYDRIEFNLCISIIHRTSSIPSYPVIVNIQNYRTVWKTYLLKQIFIFIIVNFNPDTFFKQVPLSCLLKTYFLQFINTKIISNSFYNRMCCME